MQILFESRKVDRLFKTNNMKSQPSKYWQLVWQTYALDPDENYQVPLDTIETSFDVRPSDSVVRSLRKMAHEKGYKLVSLSQKVRYDDEF